MFKTHDSNRSLCAVFIYGNLDIILASFINSLLIEVLTLSAFLIWTHFVGMLKLESPKMSSKVQRIIPRPKFYRQFDFYQSEFSEKTRQA